MAHEARQVKIRPQCLSCLHPSLICHGPKMSIPVWLNRVIGLTYSSGRFASFCSMVEPWSLQHLTHLVIKWKVAERPFMIEYVACLIVLDLAMVILDEKSHVMVLWYDYWMFHFVCHCSFMKLATDSDQPFVVYKEIQSIK